MMLVGWLMTACVPGDAAPTSPGPLHRWLQADRYREWASESVEHTSGGGHFGLVRLFVDDPLASAMADGVDAPPGSTAVLVLLPKTSAGDEPEGWAVSVKLEDGGWYEYMHYDEHLPNSDWKPFRVRFSSRDDPLCLKCHGDAPDHVLTTWPLR